MQCGRRAPSAPRASGAGRSPFRGRGRPPAALQATPAIPGVRARRQRRRCGRRGGRSARGRAAAALPAMPSRGPDPTPRRDPRPPRAPPSGPRPRAASRARPCNGGGGGGNPPYAPLPLARPGALRRPAPGGRAQQRVADDCNGLVVGLEPGGPLYLFERLAEPANIRKRHAAPLGHVARVRLEPHRLV